MKKLLVILIFAVLLAGLVFAAENQVQAQNQVKNSPFECNEGNAGKSYCSNNMTERNCAVIKCVDCGFGWFDKKCVIGCENNSCINDDWRYSGAVAYSSPDFDVNAPIIGNIRQEIRDDIKELRKTRKELQGDIKKYLKERKEIRSEIKGKNITFEKGDGEGDEIRLRVRNHTARTTLNITEREDENNNTILEFRNGDKVREIKIMPDTASERALERLRLKVCNESNNCTIVLKDVPVNKVNKLMYEIQVQRHYKLFGLFKTKAENKIQVDAENGNVTQIKKPWWAFMASEQAD